MLSHQHINLSKLALKVEQSNLSNFKSSKFGCQKVGKIEEEFRSQNTFGTIKTRLENLALRGAIHRRVAELAMLP
jgi:hypothetical protein